MCRVIDNLIIHAADSNDSGSMEDSVPRNSSSSMRICKYYNQVLAAVFNVVHLLILINNNT